MRYINEYLQNKQGGVARRYERAEERIAKHMGRTTSIKPNFIKFRHLLKEDAAGTGYGERGGSRVKGALKKAVWII